MGLLFILMVGIEDFYISTIGIFHYCHRPKIRPDYTSASGSEYWYGRDHGGDYLVRCSDHWSGFVISEKIIVWHRVPEEEQWLEVPDRRPDFIKKNNDEVWQITDRHRIVRRWNKDGYAILMAYYLGPKTIIKTSKRGCGYVATCLWTLMKSGDRLLKPGIKRSGKIYFSNLKKIGERE